MSTTGTVLARAASVWTDFLHGREVSGLLCIRPWRPKESGAKVSFYVWGERLGAEKPIQSLGVFHNDDATDGRWVLTFDDPHVLAQINSVFVTVESPRKAIREPGGRRILFAFLGEKPNHP